jgi:CheY-like chemotaxis protein
MLITKHTSFLVVDDKQPMRTIISSQLRAFGAVKITQVANGREALILLKNQPFDVILSDWNMPVMDGLELLKAVRSDEMLCHLPFVMITAETERGHIAEAIVSGVSDFLVKPYNAKTLLRRVEKALSWKPRKIPAMPEIPSSIEPEKKEPILPTILIVDDIPDNLQLLSDLFKDEYRVRVAHNGKKALDICTSENAPDLVLLDIMMPDMDGFEVAKRMREHPGSEHIPVIFVTAMTDNDTRLKGLELGAVDFVTKPIDPDVLIPRVRNFMRYVELHKQLQDDYDSMLENARLREDVEHITRHDLKNPLSGVIGLIQSLAEDGSMNRKQIDQLRLVEETALEALNIINLSSELYKIETGRFKLDAQPIIIGDVLRRIAEICRNTFNSKHITISVATDVTSVDEEIPHSLGDAMFCYSLFQNLIKNACEAAPENSRVVVMLIDSDPLKITIQNNGAVPAPIREHFFDKFVTHGKSSGTGLGTYSAKLLTEAQNGSISLDVSDEKNLSTVTVRLPRHREISTKAAG